MTRPRGIADNKVKAAVVLMRSAVAEAAEFEAVFVRSADREKHAVAEVAGKLERLRRAWCGVELDGGDVERERGEPKGGLAHVEAAQLLVEDTLERVFIGALTVAQPAFAHQAAVGDDQKNPGPAGGVEHLGLGAAFGGQRGEGLRGHEFGDEARRVVNAFGAGLLGLHEVAEMLVNLAEHADRNVREIEPAPAVVELRLETDIDLFPALQNGGQMLENLVVRVGSGFSVEPAVGAGSRFVIV